MNNKIDKIFKTVLNNNIQKNILNNKLNNDDYIKFYNKLNKRFAKENISTYDINLYINRSNNFVNNFINKKNNIIFTKAINSKFFYDDLNNLKQITQINKSNLRKKYIKLFNEKYSNNWEGFWTSICCSKNGEIKNITTFDIDDLNYLINK